MQVGSEADVHTKIIIIAYRYYSTWREKAKRRDEQRQTVTTAMSPKGLK